MFIQRQLESYRPTFSNLRRISESWPRKLSKLTNMNSQLSIARKGWEL